MRRGFCAALAGQQRQPHESAVDVAVGLGCLPDLAQARRRSGCGALAVLRRGAPHVLDEGRHVIVVARGVPRRQRAQHRQHAVGHPRAVLVLDGVQAGRAMSLRLMSAKARSRQTGSTYFSSTRFSSSPVRRPLASTWRLSQFAATAAKLSAAPAAARRLAGPALMRLMASRAFSRACLDLRARRRCRAWPRPACRDGARRRRTRRDPAAAPARSDRAARGRPRCSVSACAAAPPPSCRSVSCAAGGASVRSWKALG